MVCFLDKYRDAQVDVLYLNSYMDSGRLVDCGDGWIELVKDTGETFLIPVTAIRLLKLTKASNRPGDVLLRPASKAPDHQEMEHVVVQRERDPGCPE